MGNEKLNFMKTCNINDAFISKIDGLTDLSIQNFSPRKKKRYEIALNNNNLIANYDCRYFGKSYENDDDTLTIWIGYDFRKDLENGFYISFYSKAHKDKLIKSLESYNENYYAEYSYFEDEGYWYSVFLLNPFIYEIDKTEIEERIKFIVTKFLN